MDGEGKYALMGSGGIEVKHPEICIQWPHADEYISIDINNLGSHAQIKRTREFKRKSDEIIDLRPDCVIEHDGSGGATFVLTYRKEKHERLKGPAFKLLWGVSTIRVTPGQTSGSTAWKSFEIKGDNGEAHWIKVSEVLSKRVEYEIAKRIVRRQQQFKRRLLRSDQACAVTGEATIEVLDAAHIVCSAEGGAETLENGLLLRADIHRLWDCGIIDIDPTGEIHVVKKLSKHYAESIKDQRIPRATLERAKKALQRRWDERHSEKAT